MKRFQKSKPLIRPSTDNALVSSLSATSSASKTQPETLGFAATSSGSSLKSALESRPLSSENNLPLGISSEEERKLDKQRNKQRRKQLNPISSQQKKGVSPGKEEAGVLPTEKRETGLDNAATQNSMGTKPDVDLLKEMNTKVK